MVMKSQVPNLALWEPAKPMKWGFMFLTPSEVPKTTPHSKKGS